MQPAITHEDEVRSEPEKFDAAVRKILSVSKEELEKRDKAWKKKRDRAKKKRANP